MNAKEAENEYYEHLAMTLDESERQDGQDLADEVLGEPMDEIEETLNHFGIKIIDPPY